MSGDLNTIEIVLNLAISLRIIDKKRKYYARGREVQGDTKNKEKK